jgi:uncharacterized protein YfaS (alpha-2-macroglobulin family)
MPAKSPLHHSSSICRFAGLLAIGLALSGSLLTAHAHEGPHVAVAGPTGTQGNVHQVQMRFTDDMVALGDDRASAAAKVECKGTSEIAAGHWQNGQTWVADFAHPLAAGVACTVTPVALHTLKGESVAMPQPWEFNTGAPALMSARHDWRAPQVAATNAFSSPDDTAAILFSSAAVDPASLGNVHCRVNGTLRNVEILEGNARNAEWRRLRELDHDGSGDAAADSPSESTVAARCGTQAFPTAATVEWIWGAGIASKGGVVNSKESAISYKLPPLVRSTLPDSQGAQDILSSAASVYTTEQTTVFYFTSIPNVQALRNLLCDDRATHILLGKERQAMYEKWWLGHFSNYPIFPLDDKLVVAQCYHAAHENLSLTWTWGNGTHGAAMQVAASGADAAVVALHMDSSIFSSARVSEYPVTAFILSAPPDDALLKNVRCAVNFNEQPVRILRQEEEASAVERLKHLYAGQLYFRWHDFINAKYEIVAQCGTAPWPNNAVVSWNWKDDTAREADANAQQSEPEIKESHLVVRAPLWAASSCSQLLDNDGCDPRKAIVFDFSRTFAAESLAKLTLVGSSGIVYAATTGNIKEEKTVSRASFSGPFTEGESLKLHWEDDFRDVDGRPLEIVSRDHLRVSVLPSYLGMAQTQGTYQWGKGKSILWPLAVRNTEKTLKVHAWQFDQGAQSTADMLALIDESNTVHTTTDQILPIEDLLQPFATSKAILARLHGSAPKAMEQTVHTAGGAPEIVGVPLAGYGIWLVEADSPRYRETIARRYEAYRNEVDPSHAKHDPDANRELEDLDQVDQSSFAEKLQRTAIFQLTNLHIHARMSQSGKSLIWLTSLDSAQPVAGATVEIWSRSRRLLASGTSDAVGRVEFVKVKSAEQGAKDKPATDAAWHWVVARRGADVAILDIAAADRNSYAYFNQNRSTIGHTILDRTLFHPGETVSMQHLARLAVPSGWALPKMETGTLRVTNPLGEQVAEERVNWKADGSAESTFTFPEGAKLGQYGFTLLSAHNTVISSGAFWLEEFRLPLFDASMNIETSWRENDQTIRFYPGLAFKTGGAAAGQVVRIKGSYRAFQPWINGDMLSQEAQENLRHFNFADVETPVDELPRFPDLTVTLDKHGRADISVIVPKVDTFLALRTEMQFSDASGEVKTIQRDTPLFPKRRKVGALVERSEKPHVVRLSAIVLDEHFQPVVGETVTIDYAQAAWSTYTGRGDRSMELKSPRTVACVAKTDEHGKVACDIAWNNDIDTQGWLFRARAEGASAASEWISNTVFQWAPPSSPSPPPPTVFRRVGNAAPKIGETVHLEVRSPFLPATLLLTVEREGVLWSQVKLLTQELESIDLPVKQSYGPNITVVVNMIRGTAQLGAADPKTTSVIRQESLSIPIDLDSGRLAVSVTPAQKVAHPGQELRVGIKATRAIDQSRAAGAKVTLVAVDESLLELRGNATWSILELFWRQRYADVIGVDLPFGRLVPELPGARPDYLPAPELQALRNVNFWFNAADPSSLVPEPKIEQPDRLEAALKAKRSHIRDIRYSPLKLAPPFAPKSAPTFAPAPSEMVTVTGVRGALQQALSQKRNASDHVEAITAEDIGKMPDKNVADSLSRVSQPRSNFTTLAHWQTDVVLDDNGEANVPITLPDSLTNWRIVAIATEGAAHYGTGESMIKTSQPIQILSGLPQAVRSEDVLQQKLTVRNATNKAVTLTVSGKAAATATPDVPYAVDAAQSLEARGLAFSRRLHIEAGDYQVLQWQVTVPDGVSQLAWTFDARNADGNPDIGDAMVVKQAVVPLAKVSVRESTLVHIDAPQALSIAQPSDALSNVGGVTVSWQESLVGGAVQSARAWMAAYPYSCMEQRASKAAVSGNPKQWAAVMATLPQHMDKEGLVSYFPIKNNGNGSETLTVYLLEIADTYGLPLPAAEKTRMQNGLRRALSKAERNDWTPDKDKLAPLLAIQAAIGPDLGNAKTVVPEDLLALPSVALIDWMRYLLKTPDSPTRNAQLQAAADHLRSRYDIQGTRAVWRDEARENLWWYMWSTDVAVARATLMAQQMSNVDPSWKTDAELLIQSLIKRQEHGGWSTTTANAWGVAAVQRFAKTIESGPVSGASTASLDGSSRNSTWPQPSLMQLPWTRQGERGTLQLSHQGSGSPWATVQILAATDSKTEIARGVTVHKTITPHQQRIKGQWSEGDVVQVSLDMTADRDLSWLVVNDPIPSGSTILDDVTLQGDGNTWWWHPGFIERGNDSFRGYYQRAWTGKWNTTYLVRLNNSGSFHFPPTRLEVMYSPEIFGETPNRPMEVGPAEGQ